MSFGFGALLAPNIKPCSRGMATLKDIATRLRSVKNIQKITASMKMVSASKFARSERELRLVRPYGMGAKAFYDGAKIMPADSESGSGSGHVIIAINSDRGLCGAANSSISKATRASYDSYKGSRLVLVGDKARSTLIRKYRDSIMLTFNEVGKKAPTFEDASEIANCLLQNDFKFSTATLHYNRFKSVVSYATMSDPIYGLELISSSPNVALYDSVDDEVLQSYNEYLLASLIYSAMKEASASEHSARMTAMDAATRNAGDMIDKLALTYNRTRQAAITRELTEIISGAAAV